MSDLFFENTHTKARFKVVSWDKDAGKVTLIGRHNIPFEVDYSQKMFADMGYRPVQEDAAPPPPPPPPPVAQPASA